MDLIASAPTSIGQDIAQFRAEISATQSQLASKSGVDQSRVSRIEKGEPGTPNELSKILDALTALGSAGGSGLWDISGEGLAICRTAGFLQPTAKHSGDCRRRSSPDCRLSGGRRASVAAKAPIGASARSH